MFRVITSAAVFVAMTTFSFVAAAEEIAPDAVASFQVATNETTDEAETAADEDRVVCRRTRVTGSHRIQRVCMSQSQWTAQSDRGRENIQHQETLGQNNVGAAGQE